MHNNYGEEFFHIMGRIHKLTYQSKPICKVPKGEFIMLTNIEHFLNKQREQGILETGIKVSELSQLLKSSKPATSKMLSILEEKNYITRTTDKKDRRVVYIILTKDGEEILKESKEQFKEYTNNLFDKLGEKDAVTLIRIFNKLYQIISEDMENRKGHNNA